MPENKEFYVHIDGQLIPVNEEVYLAYYRSKRRDRYYERDIKTGSAVRNKDGNVVGYRPAKEDSLDRLMESGEDYADDREIVEEYALFAVMKDNLCDALSQLTENERELIIALFYSNGGSGMSERDYAKLKGVSQPSVNQRKARILGKLRKFLNN
jgi:RNA polymerase sigma factor (sigma-70 family)